MTTNSLVAVKVMNKQRNTDQVHMMKSFKEHKKSTQFLLKTLNY